MGAGCGVLVSAKGVLRCVCVVGGGRSRARRGAGLLVLVLDCL